VPGAETQKLVARSPPGAWGFSQRR
jgi:hypothetical protein